MAIYMIIIRQQGKARWDAGAGAIKFSNFLAASRPLPKFFSLEKLQFSYLRKKIFSLTRGLGAGPQTPHTAEDSYASAAARPTSDIHIFLAASKGHHFFFLPGKIAIFIPPEKNFSR